MNVPQTANQKGFTIIEVVLVLAIAGLIFLMVFIALPALQRNQRDTARKNEVGKVASAITSFQSNNRGQSPSANTAFAGYLDGTASNGVITLESGSTVSFASPSGDSIPTATGGASTDNILIMMGRKCGDAGLVERGTTRQAAIAVQLESGNATYCQTN